MNRTLVSALPPPPRARVAPHRTVVHGEERVDPFHWLREKGDPEVAAYLACVRCGAVQPAGRRAVATVRAAVAAALGWDASFDETPIAGVCPDCAQREGRCAG